MHPSDGLRPTSVMHWVAAPSTAASRREALCCSVSCPPAIPVKLLRHKAGGLSREAPNPPTFPSCEEDLLSGSIVKYRHHSTPLFTILRTLFLLVKLGFMATLPGLCLAQSQQ